MVLPAAAVVLLVDRVHAHPAAAVVPAALALVHLRVVAVAVGGRPVLLPPEVHPVVGAVAHHAAQAPQVVGPAQALARAGPAVLASPPTRIWARRAPRRWRCKL